MAETTKAAAAKDKDPSEIPVADHAQALVDHAREVLKEECKHRDDTDGPADNRTGSQSDSLKDHVLSMDPFKKAIPPGPDDPSKL